MKTIFVVDNSYSALFIAAKARAQVIGAEVVCANTFSNAGRLFRFLLRKEPTAVLFSWRSALFDASNSARFRKDINALHQISRIGVLIPDHLGLHSSYWDYEKKCLLACDFYLVTSEILYQEYSSRLQNFRPKGILHDLPNLDLIKEVANNYPRTSNDKPRVIWVGNSTWGKRFGFKDHKGLKTIVQPLRTILLKHDACMELEIIDSSQQRISQLNVLKKIRNSDVLIQASLSEGTGLPILEALGLGTEVLSTPVGVFNEIFGINDMRSLDILTPENIHLGLHKLVEAEIADSNESTFRFQKYIGKILLEEIPLTNKRKIEFLATSNRKNQIGTELRWFFRYARFKVKNFMSRI